MQIYGGNWTLAVFAIGIVSWVFYRFAAPKSWREWSRVGLVQAFIIALYAEMYGFPLTLYLLARFFGLDASASGNLWSSLVGVGELGMVVAMIVGYAFVFVGLFLLAGGWRQLYRARRENCLATGGLYALVRHPQYSGILLALFGEGVVHWPTLFTVGLFPVIVLAYWSLARKEENEMLRVHGEAYREYRRLVPMLLPGWGQWKRLLAGNCKKDEAERYRAKARRPAPLSGHRFPGQTCVGNSPFAPLHPLGGRGSWITGLGGSPLHRR